MSLYLRRVSERYIAADYGTGLKLYPVANTGTPTIPSLNPTPPTNLDYIATTTSLSVTWDQSTPGSGDSLASYIVYTSTNGGATWILRATVPDPSTTALITGLVIGTEYWVRIQAISDLGRASAFSAILIASTLSSGGVVATTLLGYSSTQWNTDYAVFGKPDIVRQYYGPATSIPYPTGPYPSDVPWATSWKPYDGSSKAEVNASLEAIAGGSMDSIFNTWLGKLPTVRKTRAYLVDHEWDVKIKKGNFDTVPFVHAFNRFALLCRQHANAANILVVLGTGGGPGASYLTAAVSAGLNLDNIDIVAYDPYPSGQDASQRTSYNGGRNNISRYKASYNSIFPGKKLAIGEFATRFDASAYGTDAQLAQYIRGNFDYAIDNEYDHICYYSNSFDIIPATYPLCRAAVAEYMAR